MQLFLAVHRLTNNAWDGTGDLRGNFLHLTRTRVNTEQRGNIRKMLPTLE